MSECGREVEFAERLTKTEALAKSNQHRIDDVERRQDALDSMATSMAVMAEKQTTMADKVDTIDTKVTAIEQKPAKRWESVVEKVLFLVIGAVVAFVLAKIGLPA